MKKRANDSEATDAQEQTPVLHLSHRELSRGGELNLDQYEVVTAAYCPNGHSLIDDATSFLGFHGITVALKEGTQNGRLALSPIIGDLTRTFFAFRRQEGKIVEIGCPTCSEALPLYDQCRCGAYLVALFGEPNRDFSNCIGICQRIGCLHAKLISNYSLRKFSRLGYY